MHAAAVLVLCVLVGYFVWRDAAELFVAWYSGSQEPVPADAVAWFWCTASVAAAAAITALATLRRRRPSSHEASDVVDRDTLPGA